MVEDPFSLDGFLPLLRAAARAILDGGDRFVLIRRGRAVLEHALPGPLAVLGGGVAFRSDVLARDPALLDDLYRRPGRRYLLEGDLLFACGEREVVEQLVALGGGEALSAPELAARPGGEALLRAWRAGDDRRLDEDRRLRWAWEALGVASRTARRREVRPPGAS